MKVMRTVEPSARLQSQESSHDKLLSVKMEIVLGDKTNKITEHLPIDLVTEILCRLPIKSLTVFKCVSKSWNRLISHVCIPRISADVCVLNLYRLHRSIVIDLFDACCYSDKMPELNYRGSVPKDRGNKTCYREIDCCNGLSLYMAKDICRYIVVSRSTNQYFDIPEPLEGVKRMFTALAFDPVQSNNYKIVLPHSYLDSPSLDIFSSEVGKWVRHIVPGDWVKHLLVGGDDDITYNKRIKWARKTVYLDGMLYMLTLEKHLVLFDLKSLEVSAQVIEVPCQTGIRRTGVIGQTKGVLYYVNYDKEFKLSVWQFDYHNTSGSFWILKHCICMYDMLDDNQAIFDTLKLNHRRPCRLFEPYGIHPFLDIIFLALQGRVYSYHLKSHKCELVWKIERCLDWREDFVYAFSYSYVHVKDFRKEDREYLSLTNLKRGAKLENVPGDFTGKQVSDDCTTDQPGGSPINYNSQIL